MRVLSDGCWGGEATQNSCSAIRGENAVAGVLVWRASETHAAPKETRSRGGRCPRNKGSFLCTLQHACKISPRNQWTTPDFWIRLCLYVAFVFLSTIAQYREIRHCYQLLYQINTIRTGRQWTLPHLVWPHRDGEWSEPERVKFFRHLNFHWEYFQIIVALPEIRYIIDWRTAKAKSETLELGGLCGLYFYAAWRESNKMTITEKYFAFLLFPFAQ